MDASGSNPLGRINLYNKNFYNEKKKLLIENIIKYIKPNQKILVSYSGGLDSTVLLYQLIELKKKNKKIKIRAIHINHSINKNSDIWSYHCYKQCKKNNIKIILKKINKKYKNNIECSLRIHRYKIIKKELLKREILMTAHHLNDQCETLILALKRGSGPDGLSCIKKVIQFGNKKQLLIRPFIKFEKKILKKWAIKKKLKWITDKSNFNINIERNFVRIKIIPILESKWPFLLKNFYRTTKICQENKKVINFFIHSILKKCKLSKTEIKIKKIIKFPKEIIILIIRYWMHDLTKKFISYKKNHQIYKDIILTKKNKSPSMYFKKYKLQKYKNIIFYCKLIPNIKNLIIFCHYPFKKIILPHELGKIKKSKNGMKVPPPKKTDLVNIRFNFSKKILTHEINKKCKIKKILNRLKIPILYRNYIPLLFYNETFISAIGLFLSKSKENIKKHWHISWINDI
ncbi:tRNA lysidine(34) synthetase TilS [Buchnera aphidicola (Ceratoglyphina bambusae)]|uniref:tRNA lysidine(34) synthetase TilS n=1 Tax=Buchnera aphidicola TaxID=9 RepID=UPI0031B88BFE